MSGKGFLFWDDEICNSKQKICQVSYILTDSNLEPLGDTVDSYIDPEDRFDWYNKTKIPGITEKDVDGSPNFHEFCNDQNLTELLSNYIFVAHNAANADLYHIQKSLAAYEIDMPSVQYIDTMVLSMQTWEIGSLEKACEKAGIELQNHHNAQEDVRACYRLFRWFEDNEVALEPTEWNAHGTNTSTSSKTKSHSLESSPDGLGYIHGSETSIKSALDEFKTLGMRGNPTNIESPEGKRFVVTGVVPGYKCDSIENSLKGLGAKTSSSVSGKTDYLVIGDNAGPTKIEDAKKHQGKLQVITVPELLDRLEIW